MRSEALMKKNEKKEKPTPKRCVCGETAITVKTRLGHMVSCRNPLKCVTNLRTTWRKSEDAAIVEWNTLVSSYIKKRNAGR